MNKNKISTYGKHYSDQGFSQKLTELPDKAKSKLLKKAAMLCTIMTEPDAPAWVKASIIGAFGYLICPIDAVPDVIPGAGFLDDIAVLGFMLVELSAYASSSVRKRADELLAKWAGSDVVISAR